MGVLWGEDEVSLKVEILSGNTVKFLIYYILLPQTQYRSGFELVTSLIVGRSERPQLNPQNKNIRNWNRTIAEMQYVEIQKYYCWEKTLFDNKGIAFQILPKFSSKITQKLTLWSLVSLTQILFVWHHTF